MSTPISWCNAMTLNELWPSSPKMSHNEPHSRVGTRHNVHSWSMCEMVRGIPQWIQISGRSRSSKWVPNMKVHKQGLLLPHGTEEGLQYLKGSVILCTSSEKKHEEDRWSSTYKAATVSGLVPTRTLQTSLAYLLQDIHNNRCSDVSLCRPCKVLRTYVQRRSYCQGWWWIHRRTNLTIERTSITDSLDKKLHSLHWNGSGHRAVRATSSLLAKTCNMKLLKYSATIQI